MKKINATITGVGGYVPPYILTNEELTKMVDTTEEWIVTRTGIKERHLLKEEGLGTSYMARKAVKELLKKTNTNPEDVDVVIVATSTADFHFPSVASIVCEKAGITHAFAFDLQAACSGFIFALETGSSFIQTGKYKKVIVVGADKMSSVTDYTDRSTCPLFGDAAAAVMLEPTFEEIGILDSELHTDGKGLPYLNLKAGGSACPTTKRTLKDKLQYIYQDGKVVYKYAVSNMSDVTAKIAEKNNLDKDNITWVVPHQANMRIIEAVAFRLGVTVEEHVLVNIEKYGNTSAATIPLCLWDFEKKLKKGDNLILTAFGAGFTWGAMYLKWGYDGSEID